MPQNRPDVSGIERELFDLLGSFVDRPDQRIRMGADNPPVPAPVPLVPDRIPVTGSPMLSNLVEYYKKRLPWLGKYVTGVSESLTPGGQEFLADSKIPWNRYPDTNLAGVFDTDFRDIGINPSVSPNRMEGVLAHEIAHALGQGHTRALYNAQGLGQMRADAFAEGPAPPEDIRTAIQALKERIARRR